MKFHHFPCLIALFTSLSASARPPQAPDDFPPPPAPPLFVVFDTDRDMVISAAEIQAADQVLAKLDVNGDGVLSPDEVRPPGPPPRPDGPPAEDESDAL